MPTVSNGTIAISRQDAVKRHVLGLKEKLRAGTATKLPISEIVVGDRIIPEDRNVVGQLVTSIKRIGQTTPILVRLGLDGKKILVDGLNRIAALKQLGELEVLAIVLDVTSDADAKACEAFSNGHRRQRLTALDRALIDVVQLQYVAQKVSQDATPRGGRQPKEKYHAKTAKELGVSTDQIARSCKIAKIVYYVQTAIRKRGLEDNQSLLLEVASSGDDLSAQFHTFTRILPRYEKAPKKDETLESGPRDHRQTERGASQTRGPTGSHPASPIGDGTEESESVPTVAAPSGEERKPEAVDTSTSKAKPTSSTARPSPFDKARHLWIEAEELRAALRELGDQDRHRFHRECFMAELLPATDRTRIEASTENQTQ
jgi:hypothetical protein